MFSFSSLSLSQSGNVHSTNRNGGGDSWYVLRQVIDEGNALVPIKAHDAIIGVAIGLRWPHMPFYTPRILLVFALRHPRFSWARQPAVERQTALPLLYVPAKYLSWYFAVPWRIVPLRSSLRSVGRERRRVNKTAGVRVIPSLSTYTNRYLTTIVDVERGGGQVCGTLAGLSSLCDVSSLCGFPEMVPSTRD